MSALAELHRYAFPSPISQAKAEAGSPDGLSKQLPLTLSQHWKRGLRALGP